MHPERCRRLRIAPAAAAKGAGMLGSRQPRSRLRAAVGPLLVVAIPVFAAVGLAVSLRVIGRANRIAAHRAQTESVADHLVACATRVGQRTARMVASDADVVDRLTGRRAIAGGRLRKLLEVTRRLTRCETVCILDRDANAVEVASKRAEGAAPCAGIFRSHFEAAMAGRSATFLRRARDGRWRVCFLSPVRPAEGAPPCGAVAVTASMKEIGPPLRSIPLPAALVSPAGEVVATNGFGPFDAGGAAKADMRPLKGLRSTGGRLVLGGVAYAVEQRPVSPLNLRLAVLDGANRRAPLTASQCGLAGGVSAFVAALTAVIYVLLFNIRRRRRLEDELRLHAAYTQGLLDSVQAGILVFDAESGDVVDANRHALRLIGAPPERVLGRPREAFFENGRLPQGEGALVPGEGVLKTCDGGRVPVLESVALVSHNGRRRLVESFIDLRRLKESERERARLTSAIEQVPEVVFVTDPDGRIVYANPAFERVTGYARHAALGRTPALLKSGRQDRAVYEELWRTLRRGETWSGRLINRRRDGEFIRVDATLSPVRDEAGTVVSYVAVERDVTKEVAMDEHLRQAAKMEAIGQLAAGIAHEINTPTQYVGDNTRFLKDAFGDLLRLIEAYAELAAAAAEGRPTDEPVAAVRRAAEEADLDYLREEVPQAIEQSLEGVERVAKIVAAMREFSHPGLEEKTAVDLNQAIESTLTVCRNEWKYVAETETDLDPALPLVPCLPGELNQVFLNLIVNAAHAIGEAMGDGEQAKGTIRIATRRDGEWAEVRISDTGPGIPEKIRDRIFEPFFTTKGVGKGTGQGLAISHSVVVEKHRGTLTFDTAPGRGTTFIIRLPLDDDAQTEGERESEEETAVRRR